MTSSFEVISYTLQNPKDEKERMEAWSELQDFIATHPDHRDAAVLAEKYQTLDRDWTKLTVS